MLLFISSYFGPLWHSTTAHYAVRSMCPATLDIRLCQYSLGTMGLRQLNWSASRNVPEFHPAGHWAELLDKIVNVTWLPQMLLFAFLPAQRHSFKRHEVPTNLRNHVPIEGFARTHSVAKDPASIIKPFSLKSVEKHAE